MFCKNCGKELKDGALFCANCGQKVLMPGSSVQSHQPEVQKPVQSVRVSKPVGRSKSSVNLMPMIIVVMIVVVVAVMGYFLWSKRSDAPTEEDEVIETMEDSVAEEEEPETSNDAKEEPAASDNAEKPKPSEESNSVLGSMHTYFFDCVIKNAYVCAEFESYQPSAGNMLLVSEIAVKNTTENEIEMYDTDFQAQWGEDGDDAFSVPITYDGTDEGMDILRDNQLPGTYSLQAGELRTGLLIFEIPKNRYDLSISYMEAFDDDSTGETFFINFHVEPLDLHGEVSDSHVEPKEEEASQYFLPTSDTEYLTMSDLEGFSQDDCRMARNELYARYGRRFDDPNLQAYFDALDWYEGTIAPADFDESVMNDYEIANRDLIVQYEKNMGYR